MHVCLCACIYMHVFLCVCVCVCVCVHVCARVCVFVSLHGCIYSAKYYLQIAESELPPPPGPDHLQKDAAPPMTSTPLRVDSSLGTPSTGSVTRPSAQVPPYSATPTPTPQGATHSVINVDEGTSARQFTSEF